MSDSGDGAASTGTTGSDQSGAAGAASGTPQGFVPASELEKANQRAASFQAAADRATSRVEQVMGEVKGLKSLMETFDPQSIVTQVQAGIAQARALENEAAKLRTEFPNAAEDLYSGRFATPEELRAAVESSHESKVKEIAAIRESLDAELRAEYKAKHGVDLAPQSPPPNDGGSTKVTAEDVAAMSHSERMRLTDEQLEAISRGE